MAYNYEKNWFEYKGRYYGYGTIVKLKPEVYKGIPAIENKCKGIVKFKEGVTNGYLTFSGVYTTDTLLRPGFRGFWDPNDIIEYIVEPVYVELQPVWKKAVENYNKAAPEHKHLAFTGTIWYIAIMVIGTLFNDRLFIYIIATIIYWKYWVNKYRD
jgi:hypothetical protein